MKPEKIMKILADNAYVRTSGSEAEFRAANYIASVCAELGVQATVEPFDVELAEITHAAFYADGRAVPCKGFQCAGTGSVEAPLYYMPNCDALSLPGCRGKIVMTDQPLSRIYQDLLDNGAVGFIKYSGDANDENRDIDDAELRSYVSKGNKLPGVNIHTADAVELVRNCVKTVRIELVQTESVGNSWNVIAYLPGEIPEYIALTAHYDSTALSLGVYDNMSGSVGILGVLEHFLNNPHRHGLRFIWCGSEERGLLGSKAYCKTHEEELKNIVLNINLDMIGCIMGKFIACVSAEDALVSYIEYLSKEVGFSVAARQDVYSSDSTPFADSGVPALSFARIAPHNTASIHNRFDTINVMSGEQMVRDIAFITAFTDRMANSVLCPVVRKIPDSVKEKLDDYLLRKKDQK